jgi:hypothetical protein
LYNSAQFYAFPSAKGGKYGKFITESKLWKRTEVPSIAVRVLIVTETTAQQTRMMQTAVMGQSKVIDKTESRSK